MVSLLIYPLSFFNSVLLRFINLYYYLFFIECFLLPTYYLIIKFSITPESIITISIFSLILILIYKCATFIDTVILFAGAIPQYSI